MAKYSAWLTKEGLTKIKGWAIDGLTEDQIAKNMGVTRDTLWRWKNKYSDISNALKESKEIADREVENALYKRALGYEYKEEHEILTGEVTTYKTIKKQVAPDVTAQIFWLKNRKPHQWRDTRNMEHTGKDGGPIEVANKPDLSNLTDEELESLEHIISKTAPEATPDNR